METNWQKGKKMYAKGRRIVEEAKGFPKQKAIIIAKGTAMIVEGAQLADTPDMEVTNAIS